MDECELQNGQLGGKIALVVGMKNLLMVVLLVVCSLSPAAWAKELLPLKITVEVP